MGNISFEEFAKRNLVGTVDVIGERIQAGIEAGADYGIICIPGLAYDLDPLHLFEEGVIAKLSQSLLGTWDEIACCVSWTQSHIPVPRTRAMSVMTNGRSRLPS